MTDDRTVLMERRAGGVVLVTLNRPAVLNAMNGPLRRELHDVFTEIQAARDVRAVVLAGAGRAFSSGRDLKEYAGTRSSPVGDWQRRSEAGFFADVSDCGVPVIAAIHGYCLAGGCELALACDLRVAAENAVFGLPEIDRGIWPGAGATYRLPELVGTGRALELLLTGMRIDARRAEQIGLINRVVPNEDLLTAALDLAALVAAKSAAAVRLMRTAVRVGRQLDERNAATVTGALRALVETTPDRIEGAQAFVERREARFT